MSMIRRFRIESFKSFEHVEVELGQVNVFIGANGSGKSNLLEAMGVLSAAASGQVNDLTLLQRGVRPGVPALYKSSFRESAVRASPHIFFGAAGDDVRYEATLHNPLKEPLPAWRYKTELWERAGVKLVGRSPAMAAKPNPEQGLAALKAAETASDDPALEFLRAIQGYVIYSPTTAVLRGIAPEPQPRKPVGLSGGQLPQAISELLRSRSDSLPGAHAKQVSLGALGLVDWAKSYGVADSAAMPLSPSAAASPRVIKFGDRFMRDGRNILSGYDASEGALYVLFLAAIAGHPAAPAMCAVDNADHGLNPRLARSLMTSVCDWYLKAPTLRQILLTTHNPLVLDGMPLSDDRVRLFVVARTNKGASTVTRIEVDSDLEEKVREGWTLSRLWVMGHLGGLPNV